MREYHYTHVHEVLRLFGLKPGMRVGCVQKGFQWHCSMFFAWLDGDVGDWLVMLDAVVCCWMMLDDVGCCLVMLVAEHGSVR